MCPSCSTSRLLADSLGKQQLMAQVPESLGTYRGPGWSSASLLAS